MNESACAVAAKHCFEGNTTSNCLAAASVAHPAWHRSNRPLQTEVWFKPVNAWKISRRSFQRPYTVASIVDLEQEDFPYPARE